MADEVAGPAVQPAQAQDPNAAGPALQPQQQQGANNQQQQEAQPHRPAGITR